MRLVEIIQTVTFSCSYYMDFALDTIAKIVFDDRNNYQVQTDNFYRRTTAKLIDTNRLVNYIALL